MNYLFQVFGFICEYIYDLLVLTKGDWIDHVQKLESTLNKLNEVRLKYNIRMSFFEKKLNKIFRFLVNT